MDFNWVSSQSLITLKDHVETLASYLGTLVLEPTFGKVYNLTDQRELGV